MDNRVAVYKSESVIYAARLEVASGALSITQNDLIESFCLIRQDWKTGETLPVLTQYGERLIILKKVENKA